MEGKLESDWSLEIAEYMNERYGIDIFEVVRDEIQKTIRNKIQTTRRTEMDDFDMGFNKMMSDSIEYEKLKRAGKKIPKRLEKRMKESSEWLNGLSDEDYSRLIH